jgi:hypothetical protein
MAIDPFSAVMALWALSKTRPQHPELVAWAVPSKGLGVVQTPDGKRVALGNGYAYVTDWTGKKIIEMVYGNRTDAQASIPWMDDASLPREMMFAKAALVPSGAAMVIKYKSTVWVIGQHVDEEHHPTGAVLATVDKGHFLGQNLLGSREAASALITEMIAAGLDLNPLAGGVVGGAHHAVHHHARHLAHLPAGYSRARRVIHLCTFR